MAPADCVGFEDAAAGVTAIKAARMVAIGIGDGAMLAEADQVFASTVTVDFDQVLRLAPSVSQV